MVFSFSGLKTAVRLQVEQLSRPFDPQDVADVALELNEAVADVLTTRLEQAARKHRVRAVYLAGGVAANSFLRSRTAAVADRLGVHFRPPEIAYCTDNAAMIAYAGWARLAAGCRDALSLDSFARRPIASWR